ncbi:MAG: reductase anchor subunit (DmsC) [Burkholderiales bacterium]|jgi:DMSO reductase anchor subunit|nr:reductase anchor subunit (DmsC) [Burkholderiales bacterium]
MQPAWSVILFTTLAGAGQGLYLAAFATGAPRQFVFIALVLTAAGLAASFFHLGRPGRAWRSAAMWRTSWLSREVIVLPLFMALAFAFFLTNSPVLGWLAAIACLALFLCTGMIYACLKFLQEWHTPLTVLNFALLGCASGLTLAAALEPSYALAALAATLLAGAGRVASLVRNARLKPRSSLQSAIGIKHPRIAQKAQGAIAGSFNTREFFHGRGPLALRNVKWLFLAAAFAVPAALLLAGLPAAAFAVQFCGLLAERWFFFAQANHPQNLYYQVVS